VPFENILLIKSSL